MMPPSSMQAKTSILLFLMVAFGSTGNVLLSKGMKEIGEVNQWSGAALAGIFFKVLTNGWIWLGIGFQLVFLVSFLLILFWADYSFVFPISAISYAVVAVLGYALLGETVRRVRWAGVALICLGVTLVGQTPASTRERG